MRRFRSPFFLIGLSGFFLLLILSRIPSLQAAVLTVTVEDPVTLYGQVGVDFNAQFQVNGVTPVADDYAFTVTAGTLPTDTSLYENTGQLDGIPAVGSEGQYPITLTVTDPDNAADASAPTNFTICVGIGISPAALPAIIATQAYGPVNITTTCGSGDVDFMLTGAPTGIVIDAETGVISGTTTQEGPFTLRVTATDEAGRSSFKDYPVTSTYPALVPNPANLPAGFLNTVYNNNANGVTVTFTNRPAPLTVTVLSGAGETTLPAGLTVTPSNGQFVLKGTPTVTGNSFKVVVRVTDANNRSTDLTFPFTVSLPSLTITPTTIPNATVGVAYSQQLTASGGSGTYTFSLAPGSTMPAGLSLTSTGLIDGVPTAAPGQYAFTVNVFDTSTPQRSGTRVFNLLIVGGLTPAYSSIPPVGGIISFGLVTTPGAEVSQALVITNSGTANLSVSAPSTGPIFTGVSAADFRFSGNVIPPFGVSPGGSATVVIVCRPSSTLFASIAVMTFRTNDPLRPNVSYELRCNTTVPTATPGVGTPTAIPGTARPSVEVLGRATGVVTETPDTFARLTFVKGLALRSGPYLGATMLGILRRDKDYPVLAMNGGDGGGNFNWYLVVDVDNERIGWASGRYLILKGDPNIPFTQTIFDQIDNAKDVKARLTIFGNVNIRARPSERMPVIHTTAYGTELEVIGRTQQAGITQWVQVRFYDTNTGRPIVGWVYYNFNAPELMKLTGIAPLDAVPLR